MHGGPMRMWNHDRSLDQPPIYPHSRTPLLLMVLAAASAVIVCSSSNNSGGSSGGGGAAAALGVNYGKVANNLPPPAEVVRLIQSMGAVRKSKLYDADPTVLRTFGNTGIEFTIGAGNEELQRLSNGALATAWVEENVVAYMPATRINGIVVGNEVLDGNGNGDPELMALLLPAMENVHMALRTFGLHRHIYVSTAHSFATIAASFPPSSGAFHPSISHLYMAPILRFLHQTSAPFLINVYPFFAYKADPSSVSLDYVLFRPNPGCRDQTTGLLYYNMFDAQVDAVRSAMSALGFDNLTLLVSETGWPSAGDADEPGASLENAQAYHANLVRHVASGLGTPLYPGDTPDVFLFALFNEDMKPGPTSERNYGLFHPDGTPVYAFNLYDLPSLRATTSAALAAAQRHPPPMTTPSLFLLFAALLLLLAA